MDSRIFGASFNLPRLIITVPVLSLMMIDAVAVDSVSAYSLHLYQVKLVGITIPGDGSEALASFEDSSGNNFVLRKGDSIKFGGRNEGRIVEITNSEVTIEEPPRGMPKTPLITVIKLDPINSADLTRPGEESPFQIKEDAVKPEGRETTEKSPVQESRQVNEFKAIQPDSPEQRSAFEALNQWMRLNMGSYNFDITQMHDPFTPIKSHGCRYPGPEPLSLPPLLSMDLRSFKLVAVTLLDDQRALASFEDVTGASYVLRTGDRIGRKNGRIISIEPSQVTIEEPPRGDSNAPIVTIIKLNPPIPAALTKPAGHTQTQPKKGNYNTEGSVTTEKPPAKKVGIFSEFVEISPVNREQRLAFEALNQWMRQNAATFSIDISAMQDPFSPIKEVLYSKGGCRYPGPEPPLLPPILRLDLRALKLVAITVLDGRGAFASFEDATGASYVLRTGDRIGRKNGRIINIEPSQVTIQEPPRGDSKEPIITIIKLDKGVPDHFQENK